VLKVYSISYSRLTWKKGTKTEKSI
jgi:hypothetical protein